MKWITALGLDQWADTAQARNNFPGLVGDLIRATALNVSAYRFPTGDKGQVRGFDGNLSAIGVSPFVPDGESIWEFGVTKDYEKKASDDFDSRLKTVSPEQRANTTFVFITPRTWNKGNRQITDWLNEKRDKNEWKSVEFIDGSMLESWLDEHPAVASHYARQVLKTAPPIGAICTDEFWFEFSTRFKRPLVEEVLLCGREEQAEELLRRLSEPLGTAGFAADSPDEVIAFAVAAIRCADPVRRYFIESRAVVVDSIEAVRHLTTMEGLIFLPRGQARAAVGRLASKGMTIVTAGADDVPGAQVLLPRPSMSALGKAFVAMGYTEPEGYALARTCGRSLAVLARLEPSGARERPEWMERGPELMPALLAGAWKSSAPADQAIMRAIGGAADYETFEAPLRRLTILKDPPLDKVDDVWKLRASVDAFVNLGHLIGQVHLDRLKAAATEVFGRVIPPPKPDEVYRPPGGQDEFHSSWLREGLMTTLLHIATLHSQAKLHIPGMTPQQFVDGIIRDLPGLSSDYRLLSSLQDNLSLLAEAAPDPFLEALERLLEGDASAIRPLFTEDSSMFSPRSAHVALLWALEVLAWDPAKLGRVSTCLARLAALDPGGSLNNRPINSLRSIFLSWSPNTRATAGQRTGVLRHIVGLTPSIAWQLLVKLLPKHHDISHPTAKPKMREGKDPSLEVLTYSVVWESQSSVIDMALELAQGKPERLVTLIGSFAQFQPEPFQRTLDTVEQYLRAGGVKERALVWDALRKEAKRHRTFGSTDWAIKGESLARMECIVKKYQPSDPVQMSTWLFDDWMPNIPDTGDVTTYSMDATEEARAAALKDIHAKDGLQGIMKLFSAAKLPHLVAGTVHRVELPLQELLTLLELTLDIGAISAFTAAIASDGLRRFGDQWIDAIGEVIGRRHLDSVTAAGLFLNAPETRTTWERVKRFGNLIEDEYWRSKHPSFVTGPTDDLLLAIDKYIEAGRSMSAVQTAHAQLGNVPTSTLLRLLDTAVGEINAVGGDSTMTTYYVELVFAELEKRTDVTEQDIAQREFAYLPCFDIRKKPLTLHRLMVKSPDMYISVISAVFKPSKGEAPLMTEAHQRIATSAYELLSGLTVLPGQDGEEVDAKTLQEWCVRVQELGIETDREGITEEYIGHLLAHAPVSAVDQAWPHFAVREVLEQLSSNEVENGVILERQNMRGVYSKAMGEGGAQERAFARQATSWAEAMPDSPRAAAMLLRLADSWNHYAKQEDLRAEKSALRY